MNRLPRVIIGPFCASALLLSACGGDSAPASADDAFCREIEKLDDIDIETDMSAAVDILSDLAGKAPNEEVRDALGLIAPIFQELSMVDENDASAMTEIFAKMSSPEVTAAIEVLDRYGTDVCGFNVTEDSAP